MQLFTTFQSLIELHASMSHLCQSSMVSKSVTTNRNVLHRGLQVPEASHTDQAMGVLYSEYNKMYGKEVLEYIYIGRKIYVFRREQFNPLNPELNPICYLLALLGAHHFLHVSRIRVKLLTFRLLMSYIYICGAPILDVSRSHTTTQHSR